MELLELVIEMKLLERRMTLLDRGAHQPAVPERTHRGGPDRRGGKGVYSADNCCICA